MTQSSDSKLCFKLADQAWEFEQIHKLNYRTFVEEIPQHPTNIEKRLVDRFHDENTYAIAVQGKQVMGMVAIRANRPFSLESKVENIDQYIPEGYNPVEFRLLAVEPGARRSTLFLTIIGYGIEYCLHQGYNFVLISGTTRQLKLYTRFGFEPFGPLVGTESAQYQPMYLTFEAYQQVLSRNAALHKAMRDIFYEHE